MSNKQTQSAVPKLRFPEFHDALEWEVQPLNKLAKRMNLKNKDGELKRVLTNSAINGVVDQRDYFDKDIANKSNLNGYFIVDEGDYVYNPRISNIAPVGPISKNKIGVGIMSPLYTVFRFKRNSNEFYEQYFKSTQWHHYLKKISNSGARHDRISITNDEFMGMPLPNPKPEEQQKIADCLSSVDELIAAEGQKLKALQEHKKGLMQQLFPAEGETLPKLRFPEFQSAPGWEAKVLGKYIEDFREKSTEQDQYEVLTSARSGLVRQREYYDNDSITERSNIGFNIILPGYITYRSRSDDSRFYFNENNLGITGAISIYYPVFRIKDGVNKFFIELFSRYAEFIGQYSVGNAQTVLSMNVLKKIRLPIPTRSEQKVIADCLSSIDEKITYQSQKIEALQTHKNGLMQEFFPSAEEVMG
jgi:type I restriction enzyme S subunit